MADMEPHEGSSTSNISGGNSESPVQLNIKTLDSRIHSFCVDKNIVVSAFKEKIASQVGVLVEQQRLIFRGKALKDDHPLSEYNVENEDTLHLVERQLQPSPESGFSSEETTSGHDSNAGQSRNRIGRISHNLVLGTLNVGDVGEVVIPDVSQVMGAVMNSIGIGNLAGGMHLGFHAPQGDEAGESQVNAGNWIHDGNLTAPWVALHEQTTSDTMQMPAAIDVPTLNMPILDSLNTLTAFMNQMERAFSQIGNLSNQSPSAGEDQPTTELPMNSRRLPTVESLNVVLRLAQQLLSDHAAPALSRTVNRLDQDGSFNDPDIRGQVHTESVQLGIAMQHLGALFLELGRTILTLHMGESPDESFVQAGPAVYISPSGPNPLMVQPFPLQTSSLFGGSSGIAPTHVAMGPVGVGSMPSNVNIHIHTGALLAPVGPAVGSGEPSGEGRRGESVNRTESDDSAQAHGSSGSVPLQPTLVPNSRATPNGTGSSHQKAQNSNDITSTSSRGSYNRSRATEHAENLELSSRSNHRNNLDASSGVPLGLGQGALQPKSRSRQRTAQSNNSPNANANVNVDSQPDVGDAISQLLQSPALEGLLAGASHQTGAGSPDMFRDMLQQFTRNPSMRSTVNQIAQQIDHHDLGSMFSNLEGGGGQGGQIDLSRMMQQMMPIVAQTLGDVSSAPQMSSHIHPMLSQSRSRRDITPSYNDPQIDLRPVVQRLVNHGSSEEVFRSLVSKAVNFSINGGARESVVNEICSQGELAQEFMDMFRRDISGRLHSEID